MKGKVPHIVQYQGSKRILAPQILQYMPKKIDRLIEPYLISYDGVCGGKEYGEDLPDSLHCKKIMLNAGLSSQALLLGRKSTTFEALYS